jgi:general secretion pathway protein A
MYEKHFGLRRRPFPATPDASLYYPATSHECALAPLLRAINEDEGLALLTGAPGTGKTLLCHCLLERLGTDMTTAFITNSHFPGCTAMLQAILYDLSLPYDDVGEQMLRLRLTDYLLKNCAMGRRAILLVDEAQHLSVEQLEELRLLGNLEAGQGKAFQVILVGQPDLLDTLAQPELASLNQRISVRVRAEPLGPDEAIDYVLHHFRFAGGTPETLIDEPSLEILARGTKGVPRLLNQAVHQALMLAHSADMSQIDAEAALEALALLGLEVQEPEAPPEHDLGCDDAGHDGAVGIVSADFGKAGMRIHPYEAPRPA